jgi:hypothetical protein
MLFTNRSLRSTDRHDHGDVARLLPAISKVGVLIVVGRSFEHNRYSGMTGANLPFGCSQRPPIDDVLILVDRFGYLS